MKITLDYGKTGLEVTLPDDRLIAPPLAIKPAAPLPDASAALEAALANPIGAKPLAELARGKKLSCPGIAALETVKVWHGPKFLEHPKADCGILDGNPVHEENTRIALMAGCDFIVNVCIDGKRQVTGLWAGDMIQAWETGVKFCRDVVRAGVANPVDVVVTSCAGYPLDTTWYQAVKGLTGALPIVRKGGTIVLAASLSEGLGSPEFQHLLAENPDLEQFKRRILGADYFIMDQWQLEEFCK